MTGPIRFDTIQIFDIDQNNTFDPQVDKVTDSAGNPFNPAQAKTLLDKVLVTTGHSNWKKLPLRETASYLSHMKQASDMAFLGNVDSTKHHLSATRVIEIKFPGIFPKGPSDKILSRALAEGMRQKLNAASQLAQRGEDIDAVKVQLQSAREYHLDLSQISSSLPPFDTVLEESILKQAYQKGIPETYRRAEIEALHGNFDEAEGILTGLEGHVRDANAKFSLGLTFDRARATSILKTGYRKNLPLEWDRAAELARAGEVDSLQSQLNLIQRRIQDANAQFSLGLKYDSKREDIFVESAYRAAFIKALQEARHSAKNLDAETAGKSLQKARELAQNFGLRFGSSKPALRFPPHWETQIEKCAQGNGTCPALPKSH